MTPQDRYPYAERLPRWPWHPLETSKFRSLTEPFCQGFGLDIGAGEDPITWGAIRIDVREQFTQVPVNVTGERPQGDPDLSWLMADDLDFIYSSHLLEDFEHWDEILTNWRSKIKIGGHLVILIPDHLRYRAAVAAGQPDNLDHKHEGREGELSDYMPQNWRVLMDECPDPNDYTIVFIAQRTF